MLHALLVIALLPAALCADLALALIEALTPLRGRSSERLALITGHVFLAACILAFSRDLRVGSLNAAYSAIKQLYVTHPPLIDTEIALHFSVGSAIQNLFLIIVLGITSIVIMFARLSQFVYALFCFNPAVALLFISLMFRLCCVEGY